MDEELKGRIESEEFYDLMQRYRHHSPVDQTGTLKASCMDRAHEAEREQARKEFDAAAIELARAIAIHPLKLDNNGYHSNLCVRILARAEILGYDRATTLGLIDKERDAKV